MSNKRDKSTDISDHFSGVVSVHVCLPDPNIEKSLSELSRWLVKMDLVSLNIIIGIISSVTMFAAIIFMLTYVLGSFSTRSGVMSPKVAISSLVYFFGSAALLFKGVQWLSDLARVPADGFPFYLNVGASVLALNALLHVACGLLTAFIYLRRQISEGLTLQRLLSSIRAYFRSKSKK